MPKEILVIDDSPVVLKQLRDAVRGAGHRVVGVLNGNSGLTTAQAYKYDLIFTDINMPGMNGLELIRELRKLPNYNKTPIIVLSTESNQEMLAEGKKLNVLAWMVKPFNADAVQAALGSILDPD